MNIETRELKEVGSDTKNKTHKAENMSNKLEYMPTEDKDGNRIEESIKLDE